jgi:hypothetical protein
MLNEAKSINRKDHSPEYSVYAKNAKHIFVVF